LTHGRLSFPFERVSRFEHKGSEKYQWLEADYDVRTTDPNWIVLKTYTSLAKHPNYLLTLDKSRLEDKVQYQGYFTGEFTSYEAEKYSRVLVRFLFAARLVTKDGLQSKTVYATEKLTVP